MKTYLDLEKQRFGDRLIPVFQIEDDLMSIPIPFMLLQPLVENAIKHGVGNSVDPVTVTISVSRVGEGLHFKVSDTGRGCKTDSGRGIFEKGIGLRNTQLRLEKQFNEKLEVTENEPKGLAFSFTLPLFR